MEPGIAVSSPAGVVFQVFLLFALQSPSSSLPFRFSADHLWVTNFSASCHLFGRLRKPHLADNCQSGSKAVNRQLPLRFYSCFLRAQRHDLVHLLLKGTWCSGITSASHAEGPGFVSQRVHIDLGHFVQLIFFAVLAPPAYSMVECISGSTRGGTFPGAGKNGGCGEIDNAEMHDRFHDSLAERSKAVAQGAIPKGRGFEPHSAHFSQLQRN